MYYVAEIVFSDLFVIDLVKLILILSELLTALSNFTPGLGPHFGEPIY